MQFPSEWSDKQTAPPTSTTKRRRLNTNNAPSNVNATKREEDLKALLTQCDAEQARLNQQNPNPDYDDSIVGTIKRQINSTRFAPAMPTFRENGFEVVSGTRRGIVGPAGLPAPVQQRLGAALAQVMQSAALKQVLDDMNVEIDFRSGPDLLALMRQDEATIRALRLPS